MTELSRERQPCGLRKFDHLEADAPGASVLRLPEKPLRYN